MKNTFRATFKLFSLTISFHFTNDGLFDEEGEVLNLFHLWTNGGTTLMKKIHITFMFSFI